MNIVNKIVDDYLKFSGVRHTEEIRRLLSRANEATARPGSPEHYKLIHIRQQLTRAFFAAHSAHGKKIELVIEAAPILKQDNQLGKFTDTGEVPYGGRQDEYWKHNPPKVQFQVRNAKIRRGSPMPATFRMDDERFILNFFALRGVEYGQWLSQQDRVNYLAGCAVGMYDLHRVLGFHPQQIGLYGLISVAFGARGRGKALAHFEPETYAINLTRFKRPVKLPYRSDEFERSNLIHFSGGIGTFCHEYGHALDYFAGMFVEPVHAAVPSHERKQWLSLSFHTSLRTKPSPELMKSKSLRGKMERLLDKIIWKRPGTHSDYYERVLTETAKQKKNTDYWVQRNELFARAFEVYVANKMYKRGWFNTFLHRYKYESPMYLNGAEFKTIEKDFDALISGLRSAIRAGVGSFTKLPAYQKMVAARKKKGKGKK